MRTGRTHLYWAILLMVVAVVLPTVCLLWFVGQAVKNERLAVKQKLIDIYGSRVENLFVKYSESFSANDIQLLSDAAVLSADKLLEKFAYPANSPFQGLIVYDKDGRIIYPVLSFVDDMENKPALEKAWQMEFVEKDFIEAADSYRKIADSGDDKLWAAATAGLIRCLKKAEKNAEAAEICQKLAWPEPKRIGCDRFIANARLMQIALYKDTSHHDLPEVCEKILDNQFADLTIDSPARIFLLRQCISIAEAADAAGQLNDKIKTAEKTIAFEETSLAAVQSYPSTASIKDWPEGTFRSVSNDRKIYGLHFTAGDRHILGLIGDERMKAFWAKPINDINDQTVFCRVLDNAGRVAAGLPQESFSDRLSAEQRFLSRQLGKSFPDWKVEVYFADTVFAAAARRQKIIYFWTLALVISSMVIVSILLTRSIWNQVKLNKLKNDFIATVTHELKTPLSSTRVLVDTLLDGRYEDQKQAIDYLGLISKENERLSHLIDNFLTFSRMERNKQAFDFTPTSPADIAKAAVDAVQTKFDKANCKFTLTIDENLPSLSADKNAMTTVLVNLLDNAYKYSYDNKDIELKVYIENGQVCFSVKDNGIGMSRRVVKKIFYKFYQADSSLSRQAGGCGLGLSIVKFIVDAHKGTITVKSEPGIGSQFTIRLPAGA